MTNVERIAQSAERLKSKFVLMYYLLTIATSAVLLFIHGKFAFAADVFAVVCYLAVTVLLYELSHGHGFEPTAGKEEKVGTPCLAEVARHGNSRSRSEKAQLSASLTGSKDG